MENKTGLSSENTNFIVGILFLALLLWGPIEPYRLLVRILYVFVLPCLVWVALNHFGKHWNMSTIENDRLNRAIVGVIAGLLFVGAYQSYTAKKHTECDQNVRTRDGVECVGDYVTVSGSDKFQTIFLALLGIGAVWYAVSNHEKNE